MANTVTLRCGSWEIVCNALRAKATGIGERNNGVSSSTGFYVPGPSPLRWTSPEPPRYVKDRTAATMRRIRATANLPV